MVTDDLLRSFDRRQVMDAVPPLEQIGEAKKAVALRRVERHAEFAGEPCEFGGRGTAVRQQRGLGLHRLGSCA
jgi:hypothetical protein